MSREQHGQRKFGLRDRLGFAHGDSRGAQQYAACQKDENAVQMKEMAAKAGREDKEDKYA